MLNYIAREVELIDTILGDEDIDDHEKIQYIRETVDRLQNELDVTEE